MSIDIVSALISLVALVIALTTHEFAHALMGHYLGDSTAKDRGRLTLNPLAHIDPVFTLLLPLISFLATGIAVAAAKPVPFNPWAVRGGRWGASLVALAGPLTNLLLAIFFALCIRILPLDSTSFNYFYIMVLVNVGLFVFNMIPIPPLDGSRVLYAVAPEGLRDLMDRIESAGLGFVLAVLLLFYYFGLGRYVGILVQAVAHLLVPLPGGLLP